MYQHLRKRNIDIGVINTLKEFIDLEQFDTESVSLDVMDNDDNAKNGNVSKVIENQQCIATIHKFIAGSLGILYVCLSCLFFKCRPIAICHVFFTNCQGSTSSFSIGYRFYYWERYKHRKTAEHKHLDHCQHDVHELYIPRKYKTFKEEILEYKYFGLMSSIAATKIINIKANQYLQTQRAREIKSFNGSNYPTVAKCPQWMQHPQHYGINNSNPLGIDNLFSLILYTDFDELSSDFSRSFRKIYPFESFEHVRIRNSYYWWWSKILRETVELYGMQKKYGPFFTGLSFVMDIPQYQIKLNSPTSTSTYLEVAMKFAGDQGMIIELNCSPYGNNRLMTCIKGFDCSWISKYKEEDEMYVWISYNIFKLLL